jgi:hypothetical protein
VWMFTDTYGDPDLLADHFAPVTGGGSGWVDALDYYGYWKTFDGLRNCAFYGTDCSYGLGNTPEHRYMGLWSNGHPVTELWITDDLPIGTPTPTTTPTATPTPTPAPVGGVAEAPNGEESALGATDSGGSSDTTYAIIAIVAAGVVLLAAGGWYARSRWRAG